MDNSHKINPVKVSDNREAQEAPCSLDNALAGIFIMDGWVKLHRRFLEWEWFDNSDMVKLFIYLLLNANHKDGKWKGIDIKRGQYITGLKSLCQKTKISNQTLRTCLKRLQSTGEINRQTNNQYSIITILKYESYQEKPNQTNKPANKPLTNDQQTTNNKQEKKEIQERKELAEKYDKFILFFNIKTGKNFKGDKVSSEQFNARLKEGFEGSDFRIAIENMMLDKYLKENPKFITPVYITRPTKFQMQLNAIPAGKKSDPKNRSTWTIHNDKDEPDAGF